jgi:RNA polymerase sigma factor (sigma-70 family)
LSAFGDLLCKDCQKQDQKQYPDEYADPCTRERASHQLAIALERDEKPNIRKERRKHVKTPAPPRNYYCPECFEQYESRFSWVYVQGISDVGKDWICKKCYFGDTNFEVGSYREDMWHRVFVVIKEDGELKAKYPFGIQRLPRGSRATPTACQTIFSLQLAGLMDFVEENYQLVLDLWYQYDKPHLYSFTTPLFDSGEIYDVVLRAIMKGAATCDRDRPFEPYARTLVRTAIMKEHRKRRYAWDHGGNSIDLSGLGNLSYSDCFVDREDELLGEERLIDEIVQECESIAGPDNWEMLVQWVLHGRSQESIGQDFGGITSQTVSTRIRKLRTKCQKQLQTFLPKA